MLHPDPHPHRHAHLHLERRGHRGGVILPHRSIWSLQLPTRRVVAGVLTALAFTGALAWAQPWIAGFWGEQIVWWMQGLALPGQFAGAVLGERTLFSLPVPLIDVRLRDAGRFGPAAHGLATVAVWLVAGWLPDSAKPAAFLLRFGALIHAASVLYFLVWPASFPHSVISHTGGGLRQTWALMLLTPWLHLCTYYLFPFAAWQRVALTALTLLFLFALAPLQYATHAALLYQAGLILMPLLHLLFGVMVPILGFVALYGWGMSWHDPAQADRVSHEV